jgi:hypothetical protein
VSYDQDVATARAPPGGPVFCPVPRLLLLPGILAGIGHAVEWEASEEVNQLLGAGLTEQPVPGSATLSPASAS